MAWYGWVLLTVAVLALCGAAWLFWRLRKVLDPRFEQEALEEVDRLRRERLDLLAQDRISSQRMDDLDAQLDEARRKVLEARGVATSKKTATEVADAFRALGYRGVYVRRSDSGGG